MNYTQLPLPNINRAMRARMLMGQRLKVQPANQKALDYAYHAVVALEVAVYRSKDAAVLSGDHPRHIG